MNPKYQASAFRQMRHNVFGLRKEKPVLEAFPELASLESWKTHKTKNSDKIFRYLILAYSPDSPMHSYVRDLKTRQFESARLAGFTEKDVTSEWMKRILRHEDDTVLKALVDYLKLVDDHQWTMIVTLESLFYEYTDRCLQPVSGNDDKEEMAAINMKSKLREEMGACMKSLSELRKAISSGDAELEKKIVKIERISPESIALG